MISNFTIFELILLVFFLTIVQKILDTVFTRKSISKCTNIIVWGLYYLFEGFIICIMSNDIEYILFNITFMTIICSLLYQDGIKKKLMWICLINIILILLQLIIKYIFLIMGIDVENYILVSLSSIISIIFRIILIKKVEFFSKYREVNDIPFKYWAALITIPISSIFIINTIFFVNNEKEKSLYFLITSIFILTLNIIVFQIYNRFLDDIEIEKKNLIYEKQIELFEKQIEQNEQKMKDIRCIKHDIKNHFICINEFARHNDFENIKIYTKELFGDFSYSNYEVSKSGNMVIDTILNYKYTIAKKMNININIKSQIPNQFEFNYNDICVILGNALDNAIEAVNKIKNEDMRNIDVILIYRQKNLIFKIVNPYDANLKRDTKGKILTSKKDEENHGIGLMSIKKVVKKYDGLVSVNAENNKFDLQILLYSS